MPIYQRYMVEMIRDRKNRTADDIEPRYDLLNGLLDACEDDLGGDSKLTERELMGMWPLCSRDPGSNVYLNMIREYLRFFVGW